MGHILIVGLVCESTLGGKPIRTPEKQDYSVLGVWRKQVGKGRERVESWCISSQKPKCDQKLDV